MPKAKADLGAWLAVARPAYAAAKQAERGMGWAYFLHSSLKRREHEAAFRKVRNFGDRIHYAQARLGLRVPLPEAGSGPVGDKNGGLTLGGLPVDHRIR
jgi:hypothetical protein